MERKMYQLHIRLRGVTPTIWRRLLCPSDYTFYELHVAVMSCMAWGEETVNHRFEIDEKGKRISLGIPDDPNSKRSPIKASWKTNLEQYLQKSGDIVTYIYGQKEIWEHDIYLEKVVPFAYDKCPACIGGENNSVVENCGGPERFTTLLEILADPYHPRREDVLAFTGTFYDPKEFVPEEVVFDDPERLFEMYIK